MQAAPIVIPTVTRTKIVLLSQSTPRCITHHGYMARLVVPFAVAVVTLFAAPPAVVPTAAPAVAPTAAPAGAICVGGLCDVCPAVATVLAATGEKIYCIA
jgi:hypothetical protein